jgi:hypothetical protein
VNQEAAGLALSLMLLTALLEIAGGELAQGISVELATEASSRASKSSVRAV